MNIGYTSGIFDLFHVGHLNVIRRSKLACDYLFVAVASDEVAQQLTGRTPAVPFAERLDIVRSMRYVDAAVGRLTVSTREMWQQLRFNTIYKGGNWEGSTRGSELEREVADLGVDVVYFRYTRNTSSARLRGVLDAPDEPDRNPVAVITH